ncbi:MAG: hypothetical protein KC493_17810 [Bacteriovoracaceae bacterium]|nr:hypothetical protein [Bacteriovoracaceae bacterium]
MNTIKLLIAIVLVTFQFTTNANEWIVEESTENPSEIQIQRFMDNVDRISTDFPEELIQVEFLGGKKNKSAYPAGDLYILLAIGKKDEQMTKKEYTEMWKIMNYLSDKGFRVMMNVKSKVAHIEEAVKSADTSLIMWSSHGNKSAFYDYDSKKVPFGIFNNAHKNLYQFVLSACHGRVALNKNYSVPSHIKTWAWSELTNSTEFIKFLVSDKWSAFDGKK